MIAHEVSVNGRRVCLAGIESGVFHTMIGWSGGLGRGEHFSVSIGGLDNTTDEHVDWPAPAIGNGDEIVVRVVRTDSVDQPRKRRSAKQRSNLTRTREMITLSVQALSPKQRRILLRGLIRELRQLEDEAAGE